MAAYHDDPRQGVHVRVEDPTGAYIGAHAQLLARRSTPTPSRTPARTSRSSTRARRPPPDAWHQLKGMPFDADLLIGRVSLIRFDGHGWPATKVVRLTGPAW